MDLEHRLRKALARQEPPADLIARVTARIDRGALPDSRPPFWRDRPVLALAAVLVVVVSIGFGVRSQLEQRWERQRGERAARQLVTALQIASETLNDAQRIVHQR